MTLNSDRILGRLDSKWYGQQRRHKRDPVIPATKLHKVVSRRWPVTGTIPTESAEFIRQVQHFQGAFRDLECSHSKPTRDILAAKLEVLTKSAFALTGDGLSLAARLDQADVSVPGRLKESINKIANYWHISFKFAAYARSYRSIFANLRIETLEPFGSYRPPGSTMRRFVHAEIQLIVHYELSGKPWPRVIGSSKHACFLCNAFIQAHGFFYVSNAHRRVYDRWCVPDLREYTDETTARLRKVLDAVQRDVVNEIKITKTARESGKSSGVHRLQSSINLLKDFLPTPSVTSASSDGTIRAPNAIEQNLETFQVEAHASAAACDPEDAAAASDSEASPAENMITVDRLNALLEESNEDAIYLNDNRVNEPLAAYRRSNRDGSGQILQKATEFADHAPTEPRSLLSSTSTPARNNGRKKPSPHTSPEDRGGKVLSCSGGAVDLGSAPAPSPSPLMPSPTSPVVLRKHTPSDASEVSQMQRSPGQQRTTISPSETSYLSMPWLKLYASIEPPSLTPMSVLSRGAVTLTPFTPRTEDETRSRGEENNARVVDVSDMRPGEEVVLQRRKNVDDSNDTGGLETRELEFGVRGNGGENAKVRCKWV